MLCTECDSVKIKIRKMMTGEIIILNDTYKDNFFCIDKQNSLFYISCVLVKIFVWTSRIFVQLYCAGWRGELKSQEDILYTKSIESNTWVTLFCRVNAHVIPTLRWHNGLRQPTIFYPLKCHDTLITCFQLMIYMKYAYNLP